MWMNFKEKIKENNKKDQEKHFFLYTFLFYVPIGRKLSVERLLFV